MPFNFAKPNDQPNGHSQALSDWANNHINEEHQRSLLKSVHVIPSRPLKGYKVTVEFWSDGIDVTGDLVAQIHKPNGEVFTIPLNLTPHLGIGDVNSQRRMEVANRQIHDYLFYLSSWETHSELAAKAWNELEALINQGTK